MTQSSRVDHSLGDKLESIWAWLIRPSKKIYSHIERRTSALLAGFLAASFLVGIPLSIIFHLVINRLNPSFWLNIGITLTILVFIYWVIKIGYYQVGGWLTLIVIFVSITVNILMGETSVNQIYFITNYILIVLLSTAFLRVRETFIIFLLIIGFMIGVINIFPYLDAEAIMMGLVAFTLNTLLIIAFAFMRQHDLERIESQSAQLQQKNRELDAFAHTAAHDLKNPVQAIAMYTDLLSEKLPEMPMEEIQKQLMVISRDNYRIIRIIDELLFLAQTSKVDVILSPIDMGLVINQVRQRMVLHFENREIILITPDKWVTVMGHAPWLEAAWMNYLTNAVKYGGDSPHIEIGYTLIEDNRVKFWVKDNGAGISEENQDLLFVPFTRVDQRTHTGHGLGLAIVLQIMDKLGGEVGVESTLGEGSTFFFILSLADEQPDGVSPNPTSE